MSSQNNIAHLQTNRIVLQTIEKIHQELPVGTCVAFLVSYTMKCMGDMFFVAHN